MPIIRHLVNMETIVYVLFCILIFSNAISQSTKEYRKDYAYNSKSNAFYKLHLDTKRHWQIDGLCKLEGASILSGISDYDIVQVHMMIKKYPDIGNFVWVANDGLEHESAEAQPIIDLSNSQSVEQITTCDVITRNGEVESVPCYQELPYMCKVTAADAPYDTLCKVYSRNYQYQASVGSCYKIPQKALTWNEAYAECSAEGAHLVILNSETERAVVRNITNTARSVPGTKASWFFFAGFRAERTEGNTPRVFKTIFNQTLEEAGFAQWSTNEPNNADGKEYCGSIFKNDGTLNDVDCTQTYGFICEKEI